jgi:hypothetical protein
MRQMCGKIHFLILKHQPEPSSKSSESLMNNHKMFGIALLLLLSSCGFLVPSLTETDIQQYIKAYDNFAAISPQLQSERKKSNSISILTCGKCLGLLDSATQKAGYSGFKSFLVTDIRIHYSMRYVIYLKIAQLLGSAASEVPDEQHYCTNPDNTEISDKKKKEEADRLCRQISSLSGFIKKFGHFVDAAAEKMIFKGDLVIVEKHFDGIHAAHTNNKLIDELNHSNGGEWDD